METSISFKNPEKLTYQFFLDNYQSFMDAFEESDAHPEYALGMFYTDCIDGDESLLTKEFKAEWAAEWIEDFGDDLDGLTSFDEILEANDWLDEDLANWFIDNNPSCKEKWKPILFKWISEMWNEDSKLDFMKDMIDS